MPINTETLNRKLYNKLSKYSPKPLDASGKVTPVEDEADVFKFKFAMDGKDYGDVFATVDDERRLILYYGDDVGDSPDTPTQGIGYNDTWLGFIEDLKSWKTRNGFKGWQLKNQDQLAPDMARRNHMKKKDNLGEAYYPMGKKASYSDSVPTIKMVIQHTRQIEEGEQRYRNIAKIFLENQDGERILAPTLKPGIARVYARHMVEGGKPHDERWNHIGSLCEEYTKMAGFVRATRGHQFNESAQQLVESGIEHYYTLRESLSKMTGHRGYNAYFESWTPPLMEDDSDGESINELFVQETVDPRIESVMPILSRLHKKVAETKIDKELNSLSEWAESLELIEDESLTSNNPVGIPEARSDDPDEEMDGDSCSCHAPGHPEYHGTDPHCPIHGKEADPDSWAMEENFINMAPQAVAEEEMDEGLGDWMGKMADKAFGPGSPAEISGFASDKDYAQHYETSAYPEAIQLIAKGGGIGKQRTNADVDRAERQLQKIYRAKGVELNKQNYAELVTNKIKADVDKAMGQSSVSEGQEDLNTIKRLLGK
jgi:hypothetical protein